MDSELTALAASGATTVVSLMATDSWTYVRDLIGRFLSPADSAGATVADLDIARSQLLTARAAPGTQDARDTVEECRASLQHLLQAGYFTGDDLSALLRSLQRLADGEGIPQDTVHNAVSGGVQHGPVIQSGRITELTYHIHRPAPPSSG